MNDKLKALTIKLCDELRNTTFEFFINNLTEEEESHTEIMNLVLSGHFSSLFTCMMWIAKGNPKHEEVAKKFIDQLQSYLSKIEPISKVEVLF